jgi:hypothetical protein
MATFLISITVMVQFKPKREKRFAVIKIPLSLTLREEHKLRVFENTVLGLEEYLDLREMK